MMEYWNDGMVEYWNDGMVKWWGEQIMEPVMRKNQNRGYMQLVVWQDAKDYYVLTATLFRKFPYELKRVASQQIASVDSIHRIQSLQNKRESGDWNDSFVVRECNEAYQAENTVAHDR